MQETSEGFLSALAQILRTKLPLVRLSVGDYRLGSICQKWVL